MFFGVLLAPKWFLLVPRHIPILFGSFLELVEYRPNIDPQALYLLQEYFNKYKKWKQLLKHIMFINMGMYVSICFENVRAVICWKSFEINKQ